MSATPPGNDADKNSAGKPPAADTPGANPGTGAATPSGRDPQAAGGTPPTKAGPTGSSAIGAPAPTVSPADAPKPSAPLKGPVTTPAATGPGTPPPAAGVQSGRLDANRSDANRPAAAAPGAVTSAEPAKAQASTPGAMTGGPARSDPLKPDAGTPGSGPVGALRPDAGKDGAKPEPSKSEFGKADPVKPESAKLEPAKPEPAKPEPGAPGSGPQSTSRVRVGEPLADGPIIDLKAKRVPEPAPAAAAKGGRVEDGKPATGPASGAPGAAPKIAPVPPPATRGPGFGTVAASGLIGGLVGAGLLFGLGQSGLLAPKGETTRLDALDQRIAALAPRDAVSALDKRVAANEQALKPLPDAVGKAEAAAKAASDKAGEALQKATAVPATEAAATAEGAPAQVAPVAALPPDLAARLDALDQRVSALQEEPGRDQSGDARLAVAAPAATKALADLGGRVKALEDRPAPAKPDTGLPDRIAALQSDLDARIKANEASGQALGQRVDGLKQGLDAGVKAATEAVQGVAQATRQAAEAGKTQSDELAKSVDRRLGEQAERIAGLDKAVDQSAKAATVQTALRVVAADRIAGALTSGVPYADALASLRNAEPNDGARLDALAPYADKGAPTAASLAAEFRPVAERIAAARRAERSRSVAQTGGIGDRLMSMAESIVQVKRVDTPAGAGPVASAAPDANPAAGVQDALDRGRLEAAAQAFAALPEADRAQAGEFGQRLTARVAAGAAAQAILSDAFTGLVPPAAGR